MWGGIQQKLFAEKTLTYQRDLELSWGLETAAMSVKKLKIGMRDLDGVVVKQKVSKVSHEKRKSNLPLLLSTVWDPWSSCNTVQVQGGYMPPVQEEGTLGESVLPLEPASVDTLPELVLLTDYMDNSTVTADSVHS